MCEHTFVRWDNLTIEAQEGTALPGYREPAIVRHFDAPEALDTRFYEVRAKSALNRVPERSRMPFRWTINPYRGCSHACLYCFARPTHTYLDFNAGRDFEKEIVVKVNVPEVLRVELARPSWKGEHIAMGTNTDPYQWVEGRYKLMRGIWEALRDAANPCSVLTKSPLLLRDLDLMKEVADVTDDQREPLGADDRREGVAGQRAAHAAPARAAGGGGRAQPGGHPDRHPRRAADARHQRRPAPGRGDPRVAGEAGATGVSGIALHLRGEVRGIFMEWLRSYRPDLVERYEELYARSAYAPRVEQERLGALVRRARARLGRRLPARSVARARQRANPSPLRRAAPSDAPRAPASGADEAVLSGAPAPGGLCDHRHTEVAIRDRAGWCCPCT